MPCLSCGLSWFWSNSILLLRVRHTPQPSTSTPTLHPEAEKVNKLPRNSQKDVHTHTFTRTPYTGLYINCILPPQIEGVYWSWSWCWLDGTFECEYFGNTRIYVKGMHNLPRIVSEARREGENPNLPIHNLGLIYFIPACREGTAPAFVWGRVEYVVESYPYNRTRW